MKRTVRLIAATLLVSTCLVPYSPSSAQLELQTIAGYVKVSEARVTRTVSEYSYRASLTNNGTALTGATATVSSLAGATTIVDSGLSFGPVGSGATVESLDTFSFRHDRTVPFNFSNLQWTIAPATGNHQPVANAGPDQTVGTGVTVTLNGSGSTDADGDPLTFAWGFQSRPTGSLAVLQNPTTVTPSFAADVQGDYVVRLIVNDGTVNSLPDLVVVTTGNSVPVANAGPDQTVAPGQTVTLNGSGSSDADGNPLTFSWTLVSAPAGSSAALSNPTSVLPTFVVDRLGTYRIQLTVNDGVVNSAPDTVEVRTQNTAPSANAGPDRTVQPSTLVTLDGSGSSDVDGNPLTFSWSLTSRPPASVATLSNPAAVMPTFVVDLPGDYVAQLIVNDGFEASAPDTVVITTANSVPVANAGPDQTAGVGQTVFLNGAASSDADGDPLTFSWSFTSRPAGSLAALNNPTSVGPSFTADLPGTYAVQLIVSDPFVSSAADSVTISTTNSAPVANAGPDQLGVAVGSTVTLTGAGSSDADGQALTFSWSLLSKPAGSAAELSSVTAVNPMFTGDLAGDYLVQLVVSDGFVNSAPDTVLIRAIAVTLPTVSIQAIDGGAAEAGPDPGTFGLTRSGGDVGNALTVSYTISGTATNGLDYETIGGSVVIPAGQASAEVTITPLADAVPESSETVVITVNDGAAYNLGSPVTATVTIVDAAGECGFENGTLLNGATHCGAILTAGEVDTWTFTANAGDRIAVHIGEVADNDDFRPWIRLSAPTSATLGSAFGTDAAEVGDVIAPVTGTYQVLVASADTRPRRDGHLPADDDAHAGADHRVGGRSGWAAHQRRPAYGRDSAG